MNERIKEVRLAQSPKMSQDAFGAKIGITGAAVSRIESGDRNVTDQVITAIIREFSVSEEWLRTGRGEMFIKKTESEELSEFFRDLLKDEPDFRNRLISALSRLTLDEWKVLEKLTKETVVKK